VGGGGEQDKGMRVPLWVCVISLEWSTRAPLGDRAKACAPDTLNADCVTLYAAPSEFKGSGTFILWIL